MLDYCQEGLPERVCSPNSKVFLSTRGTEEYLSVSHDGKYMDVKHREQQMAEISHRSWFGVASKPVLILLQ